MKTPMTHQEYQRLELISDSRSTKQSTNASARLRHIWQSLLSYLSNSNELRVWKASNVDGQPVWKAYDPTTESRVEFVSELDLRVWLEERYYQTPAANLPYVAR
ncbi:MAG: hypothetical protein KME07_13425 [Pegethrix bostrychoides GSE-TBD4-15B]|jgi:hypothetical protein|uniref:Uncharacterized protein n=1 Tax=Pegethrix bostrychoides GSE-TBD4-15B TaxID=2839662 RepID=A0A951PDJ1_9CYAN|nr:hypothetical protein [Pegethrix bostrychoides GSE-TBD4-15B]